MKNWLKKIKKFLHKHKKNNHLLRNIIMVGLGVFLIITSVILIWVATLKVPDFDSFEERLIINSTKIYDRTGEVLLYNVHQDIKRTNIQF